MRGQRARGRRFDDHFVRADAVHAVEQAFAFAVEIAFDPERREFVGNYAQRPAGRVFAAAIAAIGENFGRAFCLRCRGRKGSSPSL